MREYEDFYCPNCKSLIPVQYWTFKPDNPEIIFCPRCGKPTMYVEGFTDVR